jgi:hypothetical protein
MPDHSHQSLRDVARACALGWNQFGDRLDGSEPVAPTPDDAGRTPPGGEGERKP